MKNSQVFLRDYKALIVVVLIFLLTIFFIVTFIFISLGGIPPLTRFINTKYSKNFSIERFHSININDSKEQVIKKIGSPLEIKEISTGKLLFYSTLKEGQHLGLFGQIKIYRIFLVDNKVKIIIIEKGTYNNQNIGIPKQYRSLQ